MNILKAYANADFLGGQNFGIGASRRSGGNDSQEKIFHAPSGDSLSLSDEACEMLESGCGALSVCPQDATYDQHGNVMRQFDSLQNDLRNLASRFIFSPGGAVMAGKLSSLRSQLASIRAQV